MSHGPVKAYICTDCDFLNVHYSYAGDHRYCKHPQAPGKKYIGLDDITPGWCPILETKIQQDEQPRWKKAIL